MSMMERLVKAAQESPAWPAVFEAGAAEAVVRAVLEALREPSEGMLDSVAKSAAATGHLTAAQEKAWLRDCRAVEQGSRREARLIWQAMVDHVLRSPTTARQAAPGDTGPS